jgi:hypothetical protein
MNAAATFETREPSNRTSVLSKLLNVLVCPTDVFDEAVSSPPRVSNWLFPILLVWVSGFISTQFTALQGRGTSGTGVSGTVLAAFLVTILGSLWSVFVLWLMGRVFLKARVAFTKLLELVALSGSIIILDSIVTCLLIAITGDAAARPALSYVGRHLGMTPRTCGLLEVLNLFEIWLAVVLSIGLSRLTAASFKESAFWVFGYWLVIRFVLQILS